MLQHGQQTSQICSLAMGLVAESRSSSAAEDWRGQSSFSCPARHTNASLSPQMSKMKEQEETAKKSKVYRKQDCLGPGTRRNVSQGSARISNRGLYSALLRYQQKSDTDSPGGRDKGVTMRRRKTQEIPGSCTFCNCATPSNSSTPS